MAARGTRFVSVNNFANGLVLLRSPSQLGPGEAAEATNVDLVGASVRRRSGWQPMNTNALPSGPAAVTSLYRYFPQGDVPRLFAIGDRVLSYSTGGDFTKVSDTFAPSAPVYATFQTAQDTLYIGSQYGSSATPQAIQKWTSSGGLSTVSGSPSAWIVQEFGQRLWAAGGSGSQASRLWWSNSFPNQETWSATAWTDLQPGDGDTITGLGRLFNALVAFKKRSIYMVFGEPPDNPAVGDSGTMTVHSFEDQAGCVAPRSVASSTNLVVYLGRQGIYGFDGRMVTELSEPIRPLFATLDQNAIANAVGYWIEPFHYVVSVTSSGSNLPDLVISMRLRPDRSFTVWTGLNASSFALFDFSNVRTPVFGTLGNVARMDANTDNGKPIAWSYATGVIPTGVPTYASRVRRGWLWAKPVAGSVAVELLADFQSDGLAANVDLSLDSIGPVSTQRYLLPSYGVARNWQVRFSGRSTGTAPEIDMCELEVHPTNRVA
jgi:hypothetical protein